MIFNGVDLEPYFRIKDIRGRGLNQRRVTGISVPGMAGEHISSVEDPVRFLEVEVRIIAIDGNLRETIDELNEILATDDSVPIVFPDEPDKTYYGTAEMSAEIRDRKHMKWHDSIILIRRSDPFKYGPEIPLYFPTDMVSIPNKGTAEADPIFELTAKEKTTFAMVSNQDEEYMMVGKLADDDVQEVDTRTSVLYENGSTIGDWHNAPLDMVDLNIDSVDGVMGTDGGGIRPSNYGTPRNRQRGAAVTKELDESIQDFELEASFDIQSRNDIENWRMAVYLYDENMNNIGHIGLKDNTRNHKRRAPLGRVGGWHDNDRNGYQVLGDSDWFNDNARDTTLFYLRMKRVGSTFSFYIGEWQSFRHINVWEGSYNDINNEWGGQVKHIALFIGVYRDRPIPSRLRMNSVELFELSSVTEDQTPYILYPNDVVTFDHKNDDVLVNGEARNDLLNFGASFFKLKKGDNLLTVTPEGAFDVSMNYREKFR